MASNSNSKGCTIKCSFDKYIKENYFPAFGTQHLTLLRGALTDDEIRTEFIESLDLSSGNIIITSWNNMESFIDSANAKIAKGIPFTDDEINVMQRYAETLMSFYKETEFRDIIKDKVASMAGNRSVKAQAYSAFKRAIPAQYRREVLMQIVSRFIKIVDKLETMPTYRNFTRQEILNYEVPGTGPMVKIIMNKLIRDIADKYQKYKGSGTITKEQEIIFDNLLNNADAWNSVFDMAKDLLLEAEHLKLDTNHSYTFDIDNEDLETPNPEDEAPQSAEEVGPEHWQLKSDTISSFNSMTREVRSLLYKLPDNGTGILGFPNIVDVMLIHQNLLSLRADKYCTNSDEFISALENANTTWSIKLANMLKEDPYKRSIVFNTYRKNHLYYVSHNQRRESLEDKGTVTKFYRNKSGLNSKILLNHYVGGIRDIAFTNKSCIFDERGLINSTNFAEFIEILDTRNFWNESTQEFNADYFNPTGKNITEFTPQIKAENKRNFILYINDALNLHLVKEDIDTLMSSKKDFSDFCKNLRKIATKVKASRSIRSIESFLENADKNNRFKRLLKASKHTLTVQERKSPIESTFRYNKGSYVAHTIPNAIGDSLERIGKYASQGRESLRKYLEDTYLECPIYATKTTIKGVNTYTVKNEWLRRLYEASDKELENPALWVNQFINNLTRGLGTKDREFQNFTEKDNYLFTLNEYMQTFADTNGTMGVVPMFITGDSNATRYITTPVLSNAEIQAKMVDVAFQEIERMNMFQGLLDYCDGNNPQEVKYTISNGHDGTKKGDKYYDNNPLVKNANRFTFLTFLNDDTNWSYPDNLGTHTYSSWRDAYDKIGKADSTRTAFRTMLAIKIEKALDEKYETFKKDLIEKGIAKTDTNKAYGTVLGTRLNEESIYVEGVNFDVKGNPDYNFLKNFYLNTKFNLIQQLQMMTVDPGFYNSTEDMQKRYKEMIASGETLDKTAIDPHTGLPVDNNHGHQKVWYFNEITRNSEEQDKDYMDALRAAGFNPKTIDKYTSNTLTDGQGYRSFTSYRKIMIMRGLWSKEAEKVYRIIYDNRAAGNTRLSIEQLKEIDRIGVVFQPLKPFYFGHEKLETSNGIALIPVQHKYSEFPIIPELLPVGNKVGELGRAMEAEQIDLACCTTTVKVGGFGSFNIDGCNTKDDYIAASQGGYTHELDLDGWRQQSNVPEHTDTSRARGTQWTKHGYGCLADSAPKAYRFLKKFKKGIIKITSSGKSDVTISNGAIDRTGMVKLYGALGSAGFIKSSIALTNRLSTPENCSEALSQMRANDSRGSNDDISAYELDANGEFNLSPCEGIMAADNMASLLSTLRKEVIKQRMKGGSCVQVSAYGMDDILKVHTQKVTTAEGEKVNIVYADCARTFDYSITTHDGKQVKLNYFDFVDPETGKLLGVDGKPLSDGEDAKDADSEHEHYGWNTKMGKLYPGILDMIAYRIPTEKDYSILNLKARRFFPKTAGGIMMVPSQFTTIAGFDFKQYWSH